MDAASTIVQPEVPTLPRQRQSSGQGHHLDLLQNFQTSSAKSSMYSTAHTIQEDKKNGATHPMAILSLDSHQDCK